MPSKQWEAFLARAPKSLEFEDFAGGTRRFALSGWEQEWGGFVLVAKEAEPPDDGYEFSTFSYCSPDEALSELINKIRPALTHRHLKSESPDFSLLAATAEGRVSSGGVVIDGKFVNWSSLEKLMQSYEGWEFKLVFTS